MDNPFADLIPQGGQQQPQANPFADLIPKAPEQNAVQSTGPLPPESTSGLTIVPKGGEPLPQQAQASALADVPTDVVKSGLTGVERGLAGLEGLPGDVRSLAAKGIEAATGYQLPQMPSWIPPMIGPIPTGSKTTPQIERGLQGAGLIHEPQTTAGEYAQTIGEFLPAGVGGAGGFVRKAAQVILPALASETAGQATKGTTYEPWARLFGGLTGGIAAAARRPLTAAELPTATAIKNEARQYYKAVEDSGVRISKPAFAQVLTNIGTDLDKGRLSKIIPLDPQLSPVRALITSLADELKSVNPPSLTDLHSYKELAGHLSGNPNATVRAVGGIVSRRINEYISNLTPEHLVGPSNVPLAEAVSWQRQADKLWGQSKKAELMDTTFHLADLRRQNYSQAGREHALRIQFGLLARHLASSNKDAKFFSPEEKNAIETVAKGGGAVHEALRNMGKFAPRGSITGAFLFYIGQVMPWLVYPAWGATELAKYASTAKTISNAKNVRRLLVTGQSQQPKQLSTFSPVGVAQSTLPVRQ